MKKLLFIILLGFLLLGAIKLSEKVDYIPEALFIAVIMVSAQFVRQK